MSESSDQTALFDLLARATPRYPVLAYVAHVPNGEKRDKATAARLKAMGVRAGLVDILFFQRYYDATANVDYAGLAIELKTATGRTSDDQERWLAHLRGVGWRCEVCREWTRAAALILTWAGADPQEWGLV
jgi:VRR-NUC domain-containing protein